MKVAGVFFVCIMVLLFPSLSQGEVFKDATEARLSNGLKVIMLEKHNTPIVSFQVWYRATARHREGVLEKWLANPLITRPFWHPLQVAAPNNCSPSR